MSKFKEERDRAAHEFVHECPKYSGYPDHLVTFKAGFNACLESSVVSGLVETLKSVMLTSAEHSEKWNWCEEILAVYEQALAEIRGEK